MSLRHLIYGLEHLETPAGLPVKAGRLEVEWECWTESQQALPPQLAS